MSYQFLDAYSSVLTADSSVVSGVVQRPIINIASILTPVATTISGNASVSGTVGASIIGTVPVTISGSPSISGAVTVIGTPSVSGTVNIGNQSGSVVSFPQPASVSGVGVFNVNHTGNGSVLAQVQGSVITVFQNSSLLANLVSTNASVLSVNEVVRNDAVASFLGVDLTNRYMASDSAGRILMKPFAANEASIFGISSTVNAGDAASVVAVAAAGAGLRNYLTDILVVNTGSVASSITFTEGGGSILGRTIAPATGGSNIIGMHAPIRNQVPNQPINIVVGTASSVISVTVLGHKAP